MGLVDELVDDFNELISGAFAELARKLWDYFDWFFAQVLFDALVSPFGAGLGFLVNLFFVIMTVKGFLDDAEAIDRAKSLLKVLLAVFGLFIDLSLSRL